MVLRPAFSPVCQAIAQRRLLEFDYNGTPRLAIPCAHGILTSGNQALRAHQVYLRGGSRSVGIGKLYLVEKMGNARVSEESFTDPPHGYQRDDSAMDAIHCQL
jgi:hypothetical protein